MAVAVVVVLVLVFAGVAVWLRSAPEGYEDERGFHYGSEES